MTATTQPHAVTDFPPPIVAPHQIGAGELCAKAREVAELAITSGWVIDLTEWTAHVPNTAGVPARGKIKEAVLGEDGRPLLTPTGRVKTTEVASGDLLVVTTQSVRAQITWEREHVTAVATFNDGAYFGGWTTGGQRGFTGHGVMALKKIIKTRGAPLPGPESILRSV